MCDRWTRTEVEVLLDCMLEAEIDRVGSHERSQRQRFLEISTKLTDMGIPKTEVQVRSKYRGLKNGYKTAVTRSRILVQKPEHWDKLSQLFGDRTSPGRDRQAARSSVPVGPPGAAEPEHISNMDVTTEPPPSPPTATPEKAPPPTVQSPIPVVLTAWSDDPPPASSPPPTPGSPHTTQTPAATATAAVTNTVATATAVDAAPTVPNTTATVLGPPTAPVANTTTKVLRPPTASVINTTPTITNTTATATAAEACTRHRSTTLTDAVAGESPSRPLSAPPPPPLDHRHTRNSQPLHSHTAQSHAAQSQSLQSPWPARARRRRHRHRVGVDTTLRRAWMAGLECNRRFQTRLLDLMEQQAALSRQMQADLRLLTQEVAQTLRERRTPPAAS